VHTISPHVHVTTHTRRQQELGEFCRSAVVTLYIVRLMYFGDRYSPVAERYLLRGECFEYLICAMLSGDGVACDFSIHFGVRALNSFCANIRTVR